MKVTAVDAYSRVEEYEVGGIIGRVIYLLKMNKTILVEIFTLLVIKMDLEVEYLVCG